MHSYIKETPIVSADIACACETAAHHHNKRIVHCNNSLWWYKRRSSIRNLQCSSWEICKCIQPDMPVWASSPCEWTRGAGLLWCCNWRGCTGGTILHNVEISVLVSQTSFWHACCISELFLASQAPEKSFPLAKVQSLLQGLEGRMEFLHAYRDTEYQQQRCGLRFCRSKDGEKQRTIDYIWYNIQSKLLPHSRWPTPSQTTIGADALPSALFPSDHLPLMCEFRWKESGPALSREA